MTKKKSDIPLVKITSMTIGIGRRCPTCGELPPDFRDSFTRRVEKLYIIPKKSQHLTGGPGGEAVEYEVPDNCMSPEGLYTAVIVPEYLNGKVLEIREKKYK
jgi:hypothetical protein